MAKRENPSVSGGNGSREHRFWASETAYESNCHRFPALIRPLKIWRTGPMYNPESMS